MTVSDNLWRAYIAELSNALGIHDPSFFKIDTGLSAADWEGIDFTGLPPKPSNLGQPISGNIYGWADPMPRWAPASYERGNSFHDMYVAFLNNLTPSAAVTAALWQSSQFLMSDPTSGAAAPGRTFPAYSISPSLSVWYTGALQTIALSQKPALSFTVTASATPRKPAAGLANARLATPHTADPSEGGVDMPFLSFRGGAVFGVGGPSTAPKTAQIAIAPQTATSLTLSYTAQALQMFNVAPDGWYNSAFPAIYGDQIAPETPLAGKPLFGPKGLLSLTVSRIVVAFGRSVTIAGSPSQIAAIQTAHGTLGSGASVIGGFTFDLDPSQTTMASGTDTFVLMDNGNIPYVIGLVTNAIGPG